MPRGCQHCFVRWKERGRALCCLVALLLGSREAVCQDRGAISMKKVVCMRGATYEGCRVFLVALRVDLAIPWFQQRRKLQGNRVLVASVVCTYCCNCISLSLSAARASSCVCFPPAASAAQPAASSRIFESFLVRGAPLVGLQWRQRCWTAPTANHPTASTPSIQGMHYPRSTTAAAASSETASPVVCISLLQPTTQPNPQHNSSATASFPLCRPPRLLLLL